MSIKRVAAVGLLGYGLYRWLARQPLPSRAAFAAGEVDGPGFHQVRNAGPDAMAGDHPNWDRIDQASDESFPASDAPGTY